MCNATGGGATSVTVSSPPSEPRHKSVQSGVEVDTADQFRGDVRRVHAAIDLANVSPRAEDVERWEQFPHRAGVHMYRWFLIQYRAARCSLC
jgi:hypothetical protein